MVKNSPEIDRLLTEFKAQDLGVQLMVMRGFDRIVVANYSNGNECWELTQGGKDLLNPPEEVEAEPVARKPKNIDVRMPEKK